MTDDRAGDDLAARIIDLEIRIAQQDGVVADLDKVVTAQWAEIDRLKRLVADLGDRIGETESKMDAAAPQKPPPHY